MVDDLVHDERDEVRDLELDDGPAADQRRPDAGAGLGCLRDWGVDDALRSEAVHQPGGDLEEAAHLGDVLADDEHGRIALHLLVQRLVQRFGHRQLTVAHASLPGVSQSAGAYTSSSAVSGSGRGEASANSTASSTSRLACCSI